MSATRLSPPPDAIRTDERRPGFGRLTRVELRKMVDTRSGFWLQLAVAAITLITVVVATLVHHGHQATLVRVFHASLVPGGFLLPVLGILLVCGEWTQRTTLATFTLVPDRGRVLSAKLAASIGFAIVAFVVCTLFSLVFAEALGHAIGGEGGLPLVVLGQGVVYLAASMLIGVAFGAAILVSAPGIVAYLLLPTVWNALASNINALSTLDHWLDIGTTLEPLGDHALSATEWAHAGTTLALWMALPLAIGWYRFRTRDVN